MNIERLSPAMGVRIEGLKLQAETEDLIAELRNQLLYQHLVVVANQNLDDVELMSFAEKWGDLLTHPASEHRPNPYVQYLAGSGKAKGRVFGSWHSDMTWHPTPPWITMLHAREIPGFGGDTGYANQHLALEHLDQARKDLRRSHRRYLPSTAQLTGLQANHTGKGFGPNVPDSVHPIIRTHDETGRQALYVNPEFTTHITEMDPTESIGMLFPLWLHSVTEEFCYRHRWQPGDLVIWDNRSVMHTAILDYERQRTMARVVVKGDKPV